MNSRSSSPDVVAADVDLQAPPAVLQLDEGGLAEIAPGHDAAGQGVALLAPFQGCGVLLAMHRKNLSGGMGNREIIGIGIDPLLAESLQLGAPLQQEFVNFFHKYQHLSSLFSGELPYTPKIVKSRGNPGLSEA